MRCRRCGFELDGKWGFCPRCGTRKGGDMFDSFGRDLFSQIFSQMRNSFRDMEGFERMFERDIEALDLSPWFRRRPDKERVLKPLQKKGFTVHITTGTGMRPKVNVKTYGDVNKEKIEREVYDKLGVQKIPQTQKAPHPEKVEDKSEQHGERRSRFSLPSITRKSVPKCTEEPKADVKRIGDKVTVDICMPDVKSTDNIEIKELESSVEVKAVTGDKAYFKILTKPAQFGLSEKSFKDGTLHLEFS
jgi:HSP20 family molecular chaperone IbpA